MTNQIQAKDKFNALANADHIFAYKEENIAIKIIEVIPASNGCKAVVQLKDGSIKGLFTDSLSATNAITELKHVFGNDAPFAFVRLKTTAKGQSVYYLEIE